MLLAASITAASLFFSNPLPLEMPRAEGYLVTENGVRRLEDRFNKFDLWTTQTVDGRWTDDAWRVFILAHLDVLPPMGEAANANATRLDYVRGRVEIARRSKDAVRAALAALVPFPLAEKEARPRQLPRGYKDVDYWQGTNTSAIVCAFLPEKAEVWGAAVWQLAPEDDFDERLALFEKVFFASSEDEQSAPNPPERRRKRERESRTERELLRADVRHAVARYPAWKVEDTPEFLIVHDLPAGSSVISALTNDVPVMRRKYAETLPTPVDGSNVLCVARIFADRGEYLEALEADGLTNMAWTAAYWSPARRELVAHGGVSGDVASDGASALVRTFRHEAFHQYLSYATSMIPASPWLNEGYAQYFEDDASLDWNLPGGRPSPEALEQLSKMLPALMQMDYSGFYEGTDPERRLKYRLAWSIAVFLEKGAPEVRFQPFKHVKRDYLAALLESHDMRLATCAAFASSDFQEKFVAEWLKFWKER